MGFDLQTLFPYFILTGLLPSAAMALGLATYVRSQRSQCEIARAALTVGFASVAMFVFFWATILISPDPVTGKDNLILASLGAAAVGVMTYTILYAIDGASGAAHRGPSRPAQSVQPDDPKPTGPGSARTLEEESIEAWRRQQRGYFEGTYNGSVIPGGGW